jgi:monoamine oxidase
MKTDIAIVGGGLTGLALADHLTRAGCDWHLFEARSRLGGRIDVLCDDDAAFDLGPAWFWPGQHRMGVLAQRLGAEVFEQHSSGAQMIERQSGMVERHHGPSGMQGSLRIEGGMMTLVDKLQETLDPNRIHLASPVRMIGTERLHLSDGQQISANRIVLALPPRIAAGLTFAPVLAPNILSAMRDVPTWMAGQAKVVATYDAAFWRDAGLSGDAFSQRGPLVEIHDASPKSGGPAALFGFVGVSCQGRQGRADELIAASRAQLVRLFGPGAAEPRQIKLADWAMISETATLQDHEPLMHHPAYGMPAVLRDLRKGALMLAGSEVAPEFGGFLEGALASAEATALLLAGAERQ